jgi:thioredoxin 1
MKSRSLLRPFLITCACIASLASGLRAAEAKPALPRLVDLGADKCIPCKMMAPILAELAQEYAGQLDVVFIDVWKKREEAPRYGIQVIPTQIFYGADGKELFRHEGFFPKKDILAKWKELGVGLKDSATAKGN